MDELRIRSIKPEFWRSDDTDQLDWATRLVFIGLWSYVDDNGVGLYKLPSIVADLFANDFSLDPIETLNRVSTALNALESRQMITRYSVENKSYVYVCNWAKHQRVNNPNKPRFPLPTSENTQPIEGLSNHYVDPIETLPPGTGEQGNRGTGEQFSLVPENPGHTETKSESRDDVARLCTHLRDRVIANGARTTAVTITKGWADAARLLLDRDKISEDDAHKVIDWCQDDSFWRKNIMGMPKFREKYDQLRIKAFESSPNSEKDLGGW